jgi:hypothetical protein
MLKYFKLKRIRMKRLILILPLLLSAESFNDIVKSITNSLNYKLAKKDVEIYEIGKKKYPLGPCRRLRGGLGGDLYRQRKKYRFCKEIIPLPF